MSEDVNSIKKVSKISSQTFELDIEMNALVEELDNDVKLTKFNIREKSLSVSQIRCKWLKYLHLERENLKKLKTLKDDYLKKKIKKSNISDPLIRLKQEDAINNEDKMMIKIGTFIENTKNRIDFIERALNIVQDFGYNIKNTIELFKLEGM